MKRMTTIALALMLTSISSMVFANPQPASTASLTCTWFGVGCATDTTEGGRRGQIIVDN